MKKLWNVLLWVVGLLAAATASWQFYLFVAFSDSRGPLDVQGEGYIYGWQSSRLSSPACAYASASSAA